MEVSSVYVKIAEFYRWERREQPPASLNTPILARE